MFYDILADMEHELKAKPKCESLLNNRFKQGRIKSQRKTLPSLEVFKNRNGWWGRVELNRGERASSFGCTKWFGKRQYIYIYPIVHH